MNPSQQTKEEHKFRLSDLHDIAFGPQSYSSGHLNHIYLPFSL